MQTVIAYIRISDINRQSAQSQRNALIEYAESRKLTITQFVQEEISASKTDIDERKLSKLTSKGHIILMTDITRLGRKSVFKLMGTISTLCNNGGELHFANTNKILTEDKLDDAEIIFTVVGGSFAAVEESKRRSERAINAHKSRKAKGLSSGRRKGAVVKSKLDSHVALITNELDKGTSKIRIVELLAKQGVKVTRKGLYDWIERRLK